MLSKLKFRIQKNQKLYTIFQFLYERFKSVVFFPKHVKHAKVVKARLDAMERNENHIFYIGAPSHPNLGDQAQNYCIRRLLKNEYPNAEIVEFEDADFTFYSKKLFNRLKEVVLPNNLIVFQSGYCTTDKYLISERMHRNMIQHLPNNQLLFFPQTVKFYSKFEEKKTMRIYNQHQHITFLSRDKTSYETALKMFPNANVKLFPDVVTSLIGFRKYSDARNDVLFCMRDDREQFYNETEIKELEQKVKSAFNLNVDYADTTIKIDETYLKENLEKVLFDEFDMFSKYQLIITDRYHGTIFSLISGTPVIVLGSTDHKLKSGVDWFKDVYPGYIYFANNLEEAYQYANKILATEFKYKTLDDYFMKEYYAKVFEMTRK